MSVEKRPVSAAEAAFLERCREDLETFFLPAARVVEFTVRRVRAGVRLDAHVVVSGRPGRLTATGDTIVEAYGKLRAGAPKERIGLALRALVESARSR